MWLDFNKLARISSWNEFKTPVSRWGRQGGARRVYGLIGGQKFQERDRVELWEGISLILAEKKR